MDPLLIVAIVAVAAVVLFLLVRKGRRRSGDPARAESWTVGPIINDTSRSPRVPRTPLKHPEGIAVVIPDAQSGPVGDNVGELSGMTFVHGSLKGKRLIVARFRIEAGPDVTFFPSQAGYTHAKATLFFQQFGDNWSAKGKYETYRWYATFAAVRLLGAGEYELVASLDGPWTATQTSSAESNPAGFRDAIENADEVGIVFGGGDGYAHGLYATGPARLILTEFKVT